MRYAEQMWVTRGERRFLIVVRWIRVSPRIVARWLFRAGYRLFCEVSGRAHWEFNRRTYEWTVRFAGRVRIFGWEVAMLSTNHQAWPLGGRLPLAFRQAIEADMMSNQERGTTKTQEKVIPCPR